ncbi:MAG: hypothetical protein KME64_17250 [Scytonematopsis contorta HA4267-MV1]|jgi:phage tail-like protein|nr:hypothetical protein [Scytonematopsis contorta HA4267-MV1]
MVSGRSNQISSYIQYLPASFQENAFLGRFLLAFEQILTGLAPPDNIEDEISPGLEESIDKIYTYFKPISNQEDLNQAPVEFLPWLASWVALSLRDDWEEETKRRFISQIVPLYRLRGTKAGLEKILQIYLESAKLPSKLKVLENPKYPDFYFQVQITLPTPDLNQYWSQVKIAKAIIDQEKPVHTYYGLKILVPTMQLTGLFYSINSKQSGTLTATIQIDENSSNSILILRIKNSQQEVARKVGSNSPQTLTINYTIEEREKGEEWYITLANIGDSTTVKGKITISQNGTQFKTDEEFTLSAPLRIGKSPEGNTKLGTSTLKSDT